MTRIVTTVHRPKRPPRKRKAVAITGPAIVRKGARLPTNGKTKSVQAVHQFPEQPANDDRKPAIITTTSRKRAKLLRADAAKSGDNSKEPDLDAAAAMRAWLERAKWGRGPA